MCHSGVGEPDLLETDMTGEAGTGRDRGKRASGVLPEELGQLVIRIAGFEPGQPGQGALALTDHREQRRSSR
jgi:hypothetical protein